MNQLNPFASAINECARHISNSIVDVREKRIPLETGFVRLNELQIQLEGVLFKRENNRHNTILEMLIDLCDEARDVLRKELS